MKKGLKVFATGVIAMSALAMNVKADEVSTEAELNTCASKTSATCTIKEDFSITKSIKIATGTDVIVDLNGNKLTGPDDGKANWYAFIVDGGKLTLKDSSEAKTGELWAKCYGVETKFGTFIMESGKITATNNKKVGAAIVNYGGRTEVKGGTLVAASNWAVNAQSYFSDSELIISGGTFEVTSETESAIQVGGEYSKTKETVIITGGTFKGKNSFNVSSDTADVSISGGNFTTDVSEYVETGFEAVKNEKGTYDVKAIVYEVTKGENQEITVKNGSEVTITIDAEFDLFKDLYINNKLVDKKYYTVKSGSTIITLNSDYVKTLEKGEYKVTAEFTDGGTATTNLTVLSNEIDKKEEVALTTTKVENPKTSDNIITYIILTILSMLGLATISKNIYKNQKSN